MAEKGKEGHPTNPKRKGGRGGAHKDGSCSRTAATEKGDSQSADDDNNGDDSCGIFRPAWGTGTCADNATTHVVPLWSVYGSVLSPGLRRPIFSHTPSRSHFDKTINHNQIAIIM
jgi:hypothetical protein